MDFVSYVAIPAFDGRPQDPFANLFLPWFWSFLPHPKRIATSVEIRNESGTVCSVNQSIGLPKRNVGY
jgi:hypothetical protein